MQRVSLMAVKTSSHEGSLIVWSPEHRTLLMSDQSVLQPFSDKAFRELELPVKNTFKCFKQRNGNDVRFNCDMRKHVLFYGLILSLSVCVCVCARMCVCELNVRLDL